MANIRVANIRLGLISVHCSELRGVRFSENQNYCISSMVKSIGGKCSVRFTEDVCFSEDLFLEISL